MLLVQLLFACTLLCAGLVQAQFQVWGHHDSYNPEGVYFIPIKALGGGNSGALAGATHVVLDVGNFRKPGFFSIGIDGEVSISQLAAANASRSLLVHAQTFASPAKVTSDEPRFIDNETLPFLLPSLPTDSEALTTLYVDIVQHTRSERCTWVQPQYEPSLGLITVHAIQNLHLVFLITLSLSPISSPDTKVVQFHLGASFTSPELSEVEQYSKHLFPIEPVTANDSSDARIARITQAMEVFPESSHWAPNTTIGDPCTHRMYRDDWEDSHRGRWVWITVLVVAQLLTLAFVAYKIMGWRKKRSGARSAGTRETGLWEELGGSAVVEWWRRRGGHARGSSEEESGLWDELEERK